MRARINCRLKLMGGPDDAHCVDAPQTSELQQRPAYAARGGVDEHSACRPGRRKLVQRIGRREKHDGYASSLWSRQPARTSEDLMARNCDLFRIPSEMCECDHPFSDVEAVYSLAECQHAPCDFESRRKWPASVAPGGGIKTKPRYAIGEVYARRLHVDYHHAGACCGLRRVDHLESAKTSGMDDRNLPHRIGLAPRPCKRKSSLGKKLLWRSTSPPDTKPRQAPPAGLFGTLLAAYDAGEEACT